MSDEVGNEAEVHSANVQLCGGNKNPDQQQVNPTVDLETHPKVVPGMIIISPAVLNESKLKVGEILQGPANFQKGKIGSTTLQDHGCPAAPPRGDGVGTLRDSDELAGVIISSDDNDDDDEEFDLIMDITSADQQQTSSVLQDDHPPNRQSDLIQFGSFESAASSSPSPVQSRFASSSLYIADLNVNASEAYLVELFSLVGEVEAVRICHDANTGLPLGRGYVKFRTVEQGIYHHRSLFYLDLEFKVSGKLINYRSY
jgi:hypothetical protein